LTDGLDFTAAGPVNQDHAQAEETVIERGRAVVEPGTERQPSPAVDRTEAQEERPGGSSSEDETLPQAVVKTLAILESVDDHCDIARDAMSDLAKAIRTEDDDAVDAALTERPTVLDRTERIGDHTFDPLAHALGKLLVEPRPASVGPEFDQDVADDQDIGAKMLVYAQWAAFALLLLIALIATVQLYTNTSTAIAQWLSPSYVPVVQAAFNLVVLLLSLAGLAVLARRRF
jgi:hypothetical protein